MTLQKTLHLTLWQIIKEVASILFVLEELKTEVEVEPTSLGKQGTQRLSQKHGTHPYTTVIVQR